MRAQRDAVNYYEELEAQYERESREREAKAKALWENEYKNRKPTKVEPLMRVSAKRKEVKVGDDYIFHEWTKETDEMVRTKTTTFRFDGKEIYLYQTTTKSQKFLVVNGPLAGQRVTDSNPDYILFNRSSRDWQKGDKTPNCVLVHKSSFKS